MLRNKQSKTTILLRFSKNFAKFRQNIVFLIKNNTAKIL